MQHGLYDPFEAWTIPPLPDAHPEAEVWSRLRTDRKVRVASLRIFDPCFHRDMAQGTSRICNSIFQVAVVITVLISPSYTPAPCSAQSNTQCKRRNSIPA